MQDVLRYEIRGTSRAMEYYYVDPLTGVVALKKLLTEGSQTSDEVKWHPSVGCQNEFLPQLE